jgi:hypothetical protein
LSSIFNFNFKKKDENLNFIQSKDYLYNSALSDSLNRKQIKFINYGIFDIGNTKAFCKIHFYEEEELRKNFWGVFFSKTLLNNLPIFSKDNNQNHLNKSNLELHLPSLLQNVNSKNFIYIHLLMPHFPYEYYGSSIVNYQNELNKSKAYIKFWKFTNSILLKHLENLIKSNKFKIIITGDHGFKGDEKINPHLTFSAFYGFDSISISNINSVQDIGSLINNCY